jgi:hypothetical protein
MRLCAIVATIFSLVSLGTTANADPLFSVTDLGKGYHLQADPSGYVHSLTNSDGSATYVFDKSPVTVTYEPNKQDPLGLDNLVGTYTFKSGPFSVDTYHYSNNELVWSSVGWVGSFDTPPVHDINVLGQVVGLDRFTLPGMQHLKPDDGPLYGGDLLDNYIPQVPGLTLLKDALKIDDQGRIVAEDWNGHDYLLTPLALGAPATVPEPTTLMVFGAVAIAIGVRSLHRRGGALVPLPCSPR